MLAALAAVVVLSRTTEDGTVDPGPVHVHGLGVNPADGALFIATHTGLYRLAPDAEKAERVGDSTQDTMGFAVVGPDRFLGSGHPDPRADLPSLLGLVESTDAGKTWEPVSLLGETDFHVLRSTGDRIYGYDASGDRLLASVDRGRRWRELTSPGPVVDLAVDPAESTGLIAATEAGLRYSDDGGSSWKHVRDAVGLLGGARSGRLYLVTAQGRVFASADGGRTLDARGSIGGRPAAFLAVGAQDLFVALHDGTIKHSRDGGTNWAVRSAP